MESGFTVESLLKEIKKTINKYETLVTNCEKNPTKKSMNELQQTKKKVEDKIKMVKSIIKTEEDNFMLSSYEDLSSELSKRVSLIAKKEGKNKEKSVLNDLFSSSNKQENTNQQNINLLEDEKESLRNAIKMSSEINSSLQDNNNELDSQGKVLSDSTDKVVKILQKIPLIEKMFGQIRYHHIKEKLIIGCVVGFVCLVLLYIIFYRK